MVCNDIPDVPLREKRNPKAFFAEEREGWHGYIEWEKYPEKQKKAAEILAQYTFAGVRQLGVHTRASLTNCCILGTRIPARSSSRYEPTARGCEMETIPCSAWVHIGQATETELGYREGGKGGGYDTCA